MNRPQTLRCDMCEGDEPPPSTLVVCYLIGNTFERSSDTGGYVEGSGPVETWVVAMCPAHYHRLLAPIAACGHPIDVPHWGRLADL